MRGIQHIRLSTKRYSYELELKSKITIIRGRSGSGKTTLVQAAVSAMSGVVRNESSMQIEVLRELRSERVIGTLKSYEKAIVIIDEDVPLLNSHEFADAVNKSDCYFVIITRYPLGAIPYSVDSIFEIVTDKRNVHTLKPIYSFSDGVLKPDYIVCEDSNAGFLFYKLLDSNMSKVISAKGKDKVVDVDNCGYTQNIA